MTSNKLLFLGHRSLIKKITQKAVINIVFQRIFLYDLTFVLFSLLNHQGKYLSCKRNIDL